MHKLRHKIDPCHLLLRGQRYYYLRRIPKDVAAHYPASRLCFSLHTKSYKAALRNAQSLSQKLDDYWLGLRLRRLDIAGLKQVAVGQEKAEAPTLSEAADCYLKLKSQQDKVFIQAVKRNTGYVIRCLGDRPINKYSSSDAASFRDWLFDRHLSSSSVRRIFNTVKAIINLTMREFGIEGQNPFSHTFMPKKSDITERKPVPIEKLKEVQRRCRELDDEPRWLLALITESGMRLSEAIGLSKDDVKLEVPIPHICLENHKWRGLKTPSSKRIIPLVGPSLWATKRAYASSNHEKLLFPRYCSYDGSKSNSASATLNKWMRAEFDAGFVIHSFRHTFRDRLRDIQCPADIIDQLGGWTTAGIGHSYGEGYKLEVLSEWMSRL